MEIGAKLLGLPLIRKDQSQPTTIRAIESALSRIELKMFKSYFSLHSFFIVNNALCKFFWLDQIRMPFIEYLNSQKTELAIL